MREIKFRAWDKKNKKLYYFWYYEITPKGISFTTLTSPLTRISINHEDLILMQYTGIKDKNGKEIYEGDIVKAIQVDDYYPDDKPEEIITVITIDKKTEISGYSMGGPDGQTTFKEIEVIGNIYENPEMMK